jgi:hypothetical protein
VTSFAVLCLVRPRAVAIAGIMPQVRPSLLRPFLRAPPTAPAVFSNSPCFRRRPRPEGEALLRASPSEEVLLSDDRRQTAILSRPVLAVDRFEKVREVRSSRPAALAQANGAAFEEDAVSVVAFKLRAVVGCE